ncbi:MAG: D-alanyl-D-alanine carboxypeptidase family protein [Ilumatobacteraceae bacterium]|nr:D-alanyl-D-alanine carboxypeptidase family protein [Ilumatobacteraceae bacterium]
MHRRKALSMRRRLMIFAFMAAVVPLLIAAETRRVDASEPFPVFTGDEFTDLFGGLDLPGTDPVGTPPSITGDGDADSRIRSIAEGRGYELRPEMVAGVEWIDGEELHGLVADAWASLRSAAARDGIDLELVSGYRSVDDQRGIFRTELDSEGTARIGRPYTLSEIAAGDADSAIDSVLRYHSIPGYSKHHTGYAIDITMQGFDLSDFADTRGFDWLSADNYHNAKQHGFVPSYPPGARDQGPVPEPWEYVWVGKRTIICRGEGGFQPDLDADESAVPPERAEPAGGPSRFVPVDAARAFDTRTDDSPHGPLCAGEEFDFRIAGIGQVPDNGVSAVVLNVTMTETVDPGFVTVWPTGTPRPTVSSVNATRSGQTVPNLVTVPVGVEGRISFYTLSGTHLIADVFGYYEESETAQAGRMRTVNPQRVADTRTPESPEGFVEPGDTRRIDVLTAADLSADDVSAVVLNLTATQSTGPGFVTVTPHDRDGGGTSNLNVDQPGQTAANLVITPVAPDGTVDLVVSPHNGTHLIVDVFGYFTSDGHGGEPTSGLFVPLPPERTFDTRSESEPSGQIGGRETMTALVAPAAGIPADAAAAVFNLTVTGPSGPGHITAWPSASDQPEVSNVNVTEAGETRANAAILAVDDTGRLAVFSHTGAHVLADVFGYYTP